MSELNQSQHLNVMKRNSIKASKLLKLLSNSNRLLILCYLLKNELSVGELQAEIRLSQSALSQHLAKMREEGLLATSRVGTQIYYRISKPEVEAILSTLYLIFCKD